MSTFNQSHTTEMKVQILLVSCTKKEAAESNTNRRNGQNPKQRTKPHQRKKGNLAPSRPQKTIILQFN